MKSIAFLMLFLTVACGNERSPEQDTSTERIAVSMDVDEWKTNLEKNPGIVLDVRTPGEVAQGFIPEAVKMDFRSPDFRAQVQTLDKDTPVHVYCASGGRSKGAMRVMEELGFQQVYDLNGGFGAWRTQGNEVALP